LFETVDGFGDEVTVCPVLYGDVRCYLCRIWHSCRRQRGVWLATRRRVKLTLKHSVVSSTLRDRSPHLGRLTSCCLLRNTSQLLQSLVCSAFYHTVWLS